jgi:threonine dehydratase
VRGARRAHRRLAHRTPWCARARWTRGRRAGRLKAENLQRTGAFKFRGACNAVAALRPDGVCSVSSGNHAQALALAAREHGARATILMPTRRARHPSAQRPRATAPRSWSSIATQTTAMRWRCAGQGARADARTTPSTSRFVMAGQGTVGLELADESMTWTSSWSPWRRAG